MIVAAYLFGSVPYGVLVGALHGVDVTAAGSKNIGATNVGRLLGRKWGVLVFVLDVAKGLVPTLLAALVLENYAEAHLLSPVAARLFTLAVAFAAVLGHNYSAFLRFKGGRGVATTLGVCLGLYPGLTVPALVAFAVWAVVVAVSRYVSLGSVTAGAVFPFLVVAWSWIRHQGLPEGDWPLIGFALLLGGLVVYRHRANLQRLAAGTENRIGRRSAENTPSRPPAATGSPD
ncbi:MAG: glycerol-3-phosphate 1-O-acyltransferase PlsY [Phycisphaerae bacterium]|nr:glycerol-3-phosphate 1-O-acyltransferase PlsY [Phycisphaerae bacterium]